MAEEDSFELDLKGEQLYHRNVTKRERRDTMDSLDSNEIFSEDSSEDEDSTEIDETTESCTSTSSSSSSYTPSSSFTSSSFISTSSSSCSSSTSCSSSYSDDPIINDLRQRVRRLRANSTDSSSSDDELDEIQKEEELPPPTLQRSTTFERVLSDAIIHHSPIEEIKVILTAGAKLIDPIAKRPNPIHYTVWQRYPEATTLLLQQGYDVNILDDFGYSALHLAARLGYTEMVDILIRHESIVNFNPETDERFPVDSIDEPLRLALKNGHKESAQVLLENGANPNSRYFFGSEINLISPVRPDLLELLLMFGARVNEQDRNGLTPIMKACWLRKGMESLLLLLSYDGSVDVRTDSRHDNRTALHYAVISGGIDIVSVLLNHGATVRFEEDYNYPSPLHLAVRNGDIEVINLLLDSGADINCSTSIVGSVLHMACSEKISNRLEVLQLLLERGANPNIIVLGLDGTPMLPPLGDYMTASDEHEPEVIHLMLRYGAEVILKSPQTSPLGLLGCLSSLREQPDVLEELLEGAQQFDLHLIRNTSLLGSQERRLCLEVAKSPLSLRHLSRVRIRHENATARPESVMKMELPGFISKYLLYEIS